MARTASRAIRHAARVVTLLVTGSMLVGPGGRNLASGAEAGAAGTAAASLAPKPASAATIAANRKVLESLPFGDRRDFEDAKRGLIEAPETLTIRNEKGAVV